MHSICLSVHLFLCLMLIKHLQSYNFTIQFFIHNYEILSIGHREHLSILVRCMVSKYKGRLIFRASSGYVALIFAKHFHDFRECLTPRCAVV